MVESGVTPNGKEQSQNDVTVTDEESLGCEVICGKYRTGRRKIKCLQFVNNAKGAVVFLSFALFMEGLINAGLFNAVISTIEKRFQIQSTESGVVASGFDIFACIALLVIAFYGDKAFKPLWLGWGTFIMGAGCVLYSLPHFTAPKYVPFSSNNDTLCGANTTTRDCYGSTIRNYRYIFFFANGLIGLGSTPLFTLAITYIDENVKQKNSAMYGGIYYSMGAIGPAAGYLLGSALLSTYTYIGSEVKMSSTSALWIGNWWIGFLAVGIFLMLLSVAINMYPKNLPNTARYRDNRNGEVHNNAASVEATQNEEFGKCVKDAPKVFWALFTNLPYVSLTLSSCINYSFVYGFNTFGAKYIASLFGVSIAIASLTFGITAIVAAAIGQFLGGWVITKFKLDVGGILKFMIGCTVVALFASAGFLMQCKSTDFVGPTISNANSSIDVGCGTSCGCSTDSFDPVCGSDDRTYFSSCFAGCRGQVNTTHFIDCSCVSSANSSLPKTTASIGECSAKNCIWFGPFLAAIFICTLFTLMKTTPNLQATIRCVPFNLRTTAVSLQRLFFTLLGTIPGRILTGKVIDSACTSWSTECGALGACRAYDTVQASRFMTYLISSQMVNSQLCMPRKILFMFNIFMQAICLILQIITLCLYKPPKNCNDENRNHAGFTSATMSMELET